jgi:4-hydroxybenzoate polyprenyltransferase
VLDKKNKIKIKACIKAIRPYHIVKNMLLFIPLFVGHQYFNTLAITHIFLGFIIFCLLASSTYLINDLADLETDKQHINKRKRPFASGELSPKIGYLLAPLLTIFALSLAFLLPLSFLIVAISYYILSILYSFFVKQIKWLDVILLTVLYSIRIFAGMTLVENGFSLWLIFFVLFLFFSLALLKRYAELQSVQTENKMSILGRAYQLKDKTKLGLLGHISGYLSILVFIFYIYSAKAQFFYKTPLLLWLICPCLFIWLNHIWQLAQEGEILDDPVVFIVMNSFSRIFLMLIVVITLLATWIMSPF